MHLIDIFTAREIRRLFGHLHQKVQFSTKNK